MADNVQFDSRPSKVQKDIQGSDNSIPLSPQWLLPKPGENKTGAVTGENHFNPLPGHAKRPDSTRLSGTGDDSTDNHKKKDVFRPSVLESGRRENWRDEERDTNSSVRRDRWREGDREHIDNRRDRKVDSSGMGKQRWIDSGNRDNHDQRRESKWNTRWGPDEREADAVREKWGDSNKDDDVLLDKGSSHILHHGKDERDGDHYRLWRPNSSYSRGRGDSHHQNLTLNKQVPTFSHGRGRGENPPPTFSLGRGRVGLQPHGPVLEKGESGHRDPYIVSYSRTKLLDLYRTTDMMRYAKYLGGVVQVPSLTQDEPIDPLGVSVPSPEELVILKGIDKGEIVSSGAPQVSKDASAGRATTTDFMQSRRNRLGSKDDLPASLDDSKHGTLDNPDGYSNFSEAVRDDNAIHRKHDDFYAARESSKPGHSPIPQPSPWRSQSVAERSRSSSDWREVSTDIQKDFSSVWETSMDSDNIKKGEPKWQVGVLPVGFEREMEPHKISQSSPEDLVLYYKDPQGEIQGPFSGNDIITWFESGYFGIDLQVRLARAPPESPFLLLGDVMPHLRAKAHPPPGFSTPKANDIPDVSGKLNYNSFGNLNTISSEAEILKNDPRYKLASSKEAENRFLESLMAGRTSATPLEKFALSEGMQGYGGNNALAPPLLGSNSGDDPYLLAKKLTLERQRSMSNPYSLWPGSDAASVAAKTEPHPQNVESVSLLQGLVGQSTSTVNNGTCSWLNFPIQGSLDPLQDKLDIHHAQNFPPLSAVGMQQQRVHPQNASLTNLLSQAMDNPTKMLTPENLLASGITQDPKLLNLLQQQYLLQLQSQAPVASQPLSLLDMLLLKQQQHQEEQQQLMRQQQQLLSQLQAGGFAAGNSNLDTARFQQQPELFQTGSQLQAPNMRDENFSVVDSSLPPTDSQIISSSIGSDTSVHLPHQLYSNIVKQGNSAAALPEHIVEQQKIAIITNGMEPTKMPESANNDPSVGVSTADIASSLSAGKSLGEPASQKQLTVGHENEQLQDNVEALAEAREVKAPLDVKEQHTIGSSLVNEVKIPEVKEVKKTSEKKSKKQKASKVSADSVKGVSKSHQLKTSEIEGTKSNNTESETGFVHGNALAASVTEKETSKANNYVDDGETIEAKSLAGQAASQVNIQGHAGQRAWKPAPGFKPKSLLEIQQEEQMRGQEEMAVAVSEISASLSSTSVSTPWVGILANTENKPLVESQLDAMITESNFAKSDNSSSSTLKNKKSLEEDLFWESSVAKPGDREMVTSESAPLTSMSTLQTDSVSNNDFVDAKDTKKNRKKSSKSKNAGGKSAPVASADVSAGSSPINKGKLAQQMQQQKEVLPAVPSGPSLGDFVPWKGEAASPPASAWSTESGKHKKLASLRDILKEQEKKVDKKVPASLPIPTPQKPIASQPARGNGSSWPLSSPPAKAASPMPIKSQEVKRKVDDDLFWGPMEQPKAEEQSDFPQLGMQGSRGSKSTPVKGTPGGGSSIRQKITAAASPVQSSLKGKKDASTKHSEALDFKEWCESECIRLIGSNDTSILEYCLKISRSEAETLLIENLGSFDPNHQFIDQFLNYKDFLPADVLEIAFKNQNNRKTSSSGGADTSFNHVDVGAHEPGSESPFDGSAKSSKKKGKKGKKVSPSVLGFNVVSNRIMMGEIQTVD